MSSAGEYDKIMQQAASIFVDDYAAFNVATLRGVPHDSFTKVIVDAGGKSTWVPAMENLIGIKLERCSSEPNNPNAARANKRKSGPDPDKEPAQTAGFIRDVVLPKGFVTAQCTETIDPLQHAITWNDKKSIMNEVHAWLVVTHGIQAISKELAMHMGKQIALEAPHLPRGKAYQTPYWKSLVLLFRNKRKTNTQVC